MTDGQKEQVEEVKYIFTEYVQNIFLLVWWVWLQEKGCWCLIRIKQSQVLRIGSGNFRFTDEMNE